MKSYEGKISTIFRNDGIPKEGSHCICLSVILVDTVLEIDTKKYCPQMFLEECKNIIKEKRSENISMIIQKFLLMILTKKEEKNYDFDRHI